jgi:hypothetical protein
MRHLGHHLRYRLAALGVATALLLSACGGQVETAGVRVDPRSAPAPAGASAAAADGNTAQGAAFARWVQATDPDRTYILDAFVRDDRVLGVMVNPTMTKGQVQQALESLLRGMQRTFPNRSLEVIAYYQSGDELARVTYDQATNRAQTTWRQ